MRRRDRDLCLLCERTNSIEENDPLLGITITTTATYIYSSYTHIHTYRHTFLS